MTGEELAKKLNRSVRWVSDCAIILRIELPKSGKHKTARKIFTKSEIARLTRESNRCFKYGLQPGDPSPDVLAARTRKFRMQKIDAKPDDVEVRDYHLRDYYPGQWYFTRPQT